MSNSVINLVERRMPRDFILLGDGVLEREIVTRVEAQSSGATFYFTGVPCVHGHVSLRRSSTSACQDCERRGTREHKTRLRATGVEHLKYRRRLEANDPVAYVLLRARQRAKKKTIPFALTRENVAMPENCPCCGNKLTVDTEIRGQGNPHPHAPTLDRMVPSLGYVPGNVNIICWTCNWVKLTATSAQLRMVADWMDAVQSKQRSAA